jgi:hypothetical protein
MLQLLVNKADLHDARIVEAPDQALPEGQAGYLVRDRCQGFQGHRLPHQCRSQ